MRELPCDFKWRGLIHQVVKNMTIPIIEKEDQERVEHVLITRKVGYEITIH